MDKAFLRQYQVSEPDLKCLQTVKLAIFDVDGVLTDGRLYYGESGEQLKAFHVKDGVALQRLPQFGVQVAVITARDCPALRDRMVELSVEHFYPACKNKAAAVQKLSQSLALDKHEVVFVGDDIIDLPVKPHVGLLFCPADAHALLHRHSHWILTSDGGQGVAREVADIILATRMSLEQAYSF